MNAPFRDERGTAVLAVAIVGLLVAAASLGALLLARQQTVAAQRRAASAQCRALARAAVSAAAGWFEEAERGALVAAPAAADVERDGRRVDPDGDGAGTPWRSAGAPWNVRYRDAGGALFRPPDGPAPADRFAGTADGPDVLLEADGAGATTLAALSRALGVRGATVLRLAFWGPGAGTGDDALATIEATVARSLPGGVTVRARARGLVAAVSWGRLDRPAVVQRAASFTGEAGWSRGELVSGGDLAADATALASWPGGIPWIGPDRPLRADNDGDGTPDDADGDGTGDDTQWSTLPGDVPDPWWRARVGGNGPESPPASGACAPMWPFGPREVPPRPASKSLDRSGAFVACSTAEPLDPLPAAWRALVGRRGAWRATEDEASPGRFRFSPGGATSTLADVLPREGGVVVLELAASRTAPLSLRLDGRRGAVLVAGGDVDAQGGTRMSASAFAPGDPADTRGAERAGSPADPFRPVWPAAGRCDGWSVAPWVEPGGGTPSTARGCGADDRHWEGIVAADGRLRIEGPARIVGQVRGALLEADGGTGPVRLEAAVPAGRPGPPGAPRIVVRELRTGP